jgi:Golgi SNAP receptor complex protein 2
MTSFSRTIEDYANAAQNELISDRKEKAMARIDKFRHELTDAREQLRQLKLQREESVNAAKRDELFSRRGHHSGANAESSVPENPYLNGNSATFSSMSRAEGLERESNVLGRAGQQLDEFIAGAQSVLQDLGEQREFLRSTQRAIYSVGNTLGLSNETIRMVERRALQDKWIFYAGVIVMFVSFYYILKWFS